MSTNKASKPVSQSFAQTVADAVSQLEQVNKDLGEAPPMTAVQKRHSAKPRKGATRIVNDIADLVKAHKLDSEALDSKLMVENQKTADALGPLVVQLTKLLQRVTDQRFVATANAWQAGLQFYALLQHRAPTDLQLAANLAPIKEAFSYRHSAVLENKPTKLQTRAKAKFAQAQELMAHAHDRVGAQPVAPVATAPAPVATQPVSAPVAAPVYSPVSQPVSAPVTTQMFVTPKSNGALNGSYNGASNGAVNGSGG